MIDELQRVKEFRISEPAPSEAARNAARAALVRAIVHEHDKRRAAVRAQPAVG